MNLLLAEWSGLTYHMIDEKAPKHVVRVTDKNGRQATFDIDQHRNLTNQLRSEDYARAQKVIRKCAGNFIDYWNEMTQP